MNWTNLWNRLLGQPRELDAELDDELAFHGEMKRRDLERQGLSPEDAARAARLSLGNLTQSREEAREAWQFVWLSDLWRDVRYGARTLRANPGFTVAATLALALGIGLNGIVFTVYNALALSPWAIRDVARVVQISTEHAPGKWRGLSWPEFQYLSANATTLDSIVASTSAGLRLREGSDTWSANGISASANFFQGIGTGFTLGRGFSAAAADALHPAPELVLQYNTWQSRFGGDPNTVGRWIEVNGHQLQIVGVAAEGFSGPSPTVPQLWIPAAWIDRLNPGSNSYTSADSCCITVFGHLRPGISRDQANAELQTLSRRFRESLRLEPGRIGLTDPTLLANPGLEKRASLIFVLLGVASLLILLLACANVANLQLARAQTRRRELAVRLSLGASRSRVLRQLLAESVLLAGLAAALTLVLCQTAPALLTTTIAANREQISMDFHTDWRVVAFLLACSFATGILFGLAPALSVLRDAVSGGLRENSRTVAGGRLRLVFLVAQVAVCATVLGAAALLARAMQQSQTVDAGFRSESVIVLSPNLLSSGLSDELAGALTASLVDRVRQLPGVASVAHSTIIPLGNVSTGVTISRTKSTEKLDCSFAKVSANYLEVLAIPMLAGRGFTAAEESRADIILINEALAQTLFPNENPLGKTIDVLGQRQVIGVVRNSSAREISPVPVPFFYLPTRGERLTRLLLRHTGPAAPLVAELPKIAQAVDKRVLATAEPLEETVTRAKRVAVVTASIAGTLSALSLLLACIGIYGVAAYHVAQRTREIGVRMALGAMPAQIVAMVLRQNLAAVGIGAAIGIAGALGLAQLLRSMLFGIRPTDPAALAMTILILSAMALVAALPNARRAAAIAPSAALRHD